MKELDKQLAKKLINEISDSNMTFQRKMKVLKLLDKAFRKHLGLFYLTDKELEEGDILYRSM